MKRPFPSFLLVVIVPAGAAMALAASQTASAWDAVQRDSHTRVARMVLAATAEELRTTPDTAAESAPRAPTSVARSTQYRIALYRDGRFWTGSEPPPGPQTVPADLPANPGSGEGVPAGEDPHRGVFLAAPPGTAPPSLVALAAPRNSAGPLVEGPVLLVMGLLLLFGALTGWIQLTRRDVHRRSLLLGGAVGPALVPALAVLVFFIHLDRSFHQAADAAVGRDLARALAVAAAEGAADDPARVRTLTGFHATRVRDGRTEASSLRGALAEVAALPVPPSSFTSSGSVRTAEGPSVYVARRLDDGALLVATAPLPEARVAGFRKTLFLLGLVLAAWWTVAATVAWLLSWLLGAGSAEKPVP